jgi:hypothetical protein
MAFCPEMACHPAPYLRWAGLKCPEEVLSITEIEDKVAA